MDALYHASDSTVRAILTALCDDRRVYAKALQYLDLLEPGAKTKAKSAAMSGTDSKKRKPISTLSICVQCDEPFYEDSTEKCRYHYGKSRFYSSPLLSFNVAVIISSKVSIGGLTVGIGELEPDYESDFWADHDENCHGTINTDEMREEFPDGFEWTCCEQLGSAPGCKLGRHESNPEKSKKGKYVSDSEDNIGTSEDNEEEGDESEEDEE